VKKATIVTTSWDDGDKCDLKVAEFLSSRGMRGTFYVPIKPFKPRPRLVAADLSSLALEGFEIGAHGFAHEDLTSLSSEEVARVVALCKQTLEGILGTEVSMFCYPRGRFNRNVAHRLRLAGYSGARTVRMLATGFDFQPFEMPTSLQVYPHSRTTYVRNTARAGRVARLYDYLTQLSQGDGWVELGKKLFDRVVREGGVWHLFGHSWEIDQLGLWGDLGKMLDYVSKQKGAVYIPNGEVLGYLRMQRRAAQQIRGGS
jgi:peptidoglycan/xylan/chitin deacetylase (PgdA/CDA1 family)